MIPHQRCYPSELTVRTWRGHEILDATQFELFLKGGVKERVLDAEFEDQFESDLVALATTQMATDTLRKVLQTSPPPLDWEIGEAVAECLLQDEFGVQWPWNENRDRKTPRASLPGADLVGLFKDDTGDLLLFGEVKTSADLNAPPGVMAGRGGLAHQIDQLATTLSIQATLLRWLHARCRGTGDWPACQAATARYLKSGGRDVALVGVLLRDTTPHENDLRTRGQALARTEAATRDMVRLDAWYVPLPIQQWVATVTSP